jgi:hypothetical protein
MIHLIVKSIAFIFIIYYNKYFLNKLVDIYYILLNIIATQVIMGSQKVKSSYNKIPICKTLIHRKDPNILKFKFRHEFTHIQRKEVEELLESDWFISNLIKYPPSKINGEDIYEIWEDKSTAMSLFDSLRFSSLIVYPNVSLEYLLLLGQKWGVPDCLIEEIHKRIELQNEDDKVDNNPIANIVKTLPLKCINCNRGFFTNENTSRSCCYHPNYYNNNIDKWACCGREDHNDPGCITGCHVPFTSNQLINMLNIGELKIDDE